MLSFTQARTKLAVCVCVRFSRLVGFIAVEVADWLPSGKRSPAGEAGHGKREEGMNVAQKLVVNPKQCPSLCCGKVAIKGRKSTAVYYYCFVVNF